jgi:tRNA threonylcarbamoyladenosine biosynthesis protein TsaE
LEFTLDNIGEASSLFISGMNDHRIFAFHGEMGAGKTTLIHHICDAMGVKDIVGSPTFSIINEYESGGYGTIYHIDLYRIKDEDEAMQAGVEDCIYSGNICFIEWPGKAAGLLPEETVHIHLKVVNEDTRSLSIGNRE